jgi:hypothetical protein
LAIEQGTPVVYVPWVWQPISWVIRLLPRFALRRVAF